MRVIRINYGLKGFVNVYKVVRFKAGSDLASKVSRINQQREEFRQLRIRALQDIKSASPEEREKIIDVSLVIPLIEEAKNMIVENEAKMEELKAKYESLLEVENPRGVGEEARAIAKELKAEIENLHAKLREIVMAVKEIAIVVDTEPEDPTK